MNVGLSVITELIIGGIGAVVWVLIWLSVAMGGRVVYYFKDTPVTVLILGLGIAAYVLGIIIDRFLFALSSKYAPFSFPKDAKALEQQFLAATNVDKCAKDLYTTDPNKGIKVEKFIRCKLAELGEKIDYNKNRMIIAQAWTLNSFLIYLGLACLRLRFDVPWAVLIAAGVFCAAVTFTARALTRDYHKDLLCSLPLALAKKD